MRIFGTSFARGCPVPTGEAATNWTITTSAVAYTNGGYLGGICAAANNSPVTVTVTKSTAFSKLSGSYRIKWPTLSAGATIFTAGLVTLRTVSASVVGIYVNAVSVATLTGLTLTDNTWHGIQFLIDLTAPSGTVTVIVNGASATFNGHTGSHSVTAVTLSSGGGGSGSFVYGIDDILVNDDTTADNNGIPPLVRELRPNKIALGTSNDWNVTGPLSYPVLPGNYGRAGGTGSVFAYNAVTGRVVYTAGGGSNFGNNILTVFDTSGNILYSVDSGRAYAAPRLLPIEGTANVLIGNSVDNDSLHSFINTATGVVSTLQSPFTGNLVSALDGTLWLITQVYLQKFSSAGAYLAGGPGSYTSGSQTFMFPSANGKLYIPTTGNILNVITTGPNTLATIASVTSSPSYQGGAVENAAANRIYFAIGSSVYEINSAAGTLVSTTSITVDVRNLNNYNRNGMLSIAADFANSRIFVLRSSGDIVAMNTTTLAVTTYGTAPTGTNGQAIAVSNGYLYCVGDTKISSWNLTTNVQAADVTIQATTVAGSYQKCQASGNSIFFTESNTFSQFDTTTRALVPVSKILAAKNVRLGSTNTTAIRGLSTANQKQQYVLEDKSAGVATVEQINVGALNAAKIGALSGNLQLGVTLAGTDIGATVTGLSPSLATLGVALPFKSGTTKFAAADLAALQIYSKATT